MPDPLVSVVVPTYNRLSLLQEAVGSVLAQSFRDRELIVVDDGSTDGTEAYGQALRGTGVRYLRRRHSGRPGAVRNAGAALARGRFLAFLDSDDLWLSEKLELQLSRLREQAGVRICHTRELWLRQGRRVSQSGQRHRREGDLFADSLRKCIIGPSTVLVDRALFQAAGGFREDLEIAEDYELWLRLTAREKVTYLDRPLVVKRAGHPGQLSEKYGQIEIFRIRALLLFLGDQTLPAENRRLAAAELARKCRIHAAGCRKRGREEEARQVLELAEKVTSRS